MRTAYVVLSVLVIALGLVLVVSPLARGLGFTVGALLGVVLVLAGSFRLSRELRPPG